jgi:ADP-ribosyl-[dinitrogen reductase] hydrolase
MLHRALAGEAKDAILLSAGSPAISAIARGAYRARYETEIAGSGYVVTSLEAALWCFARAESFAEAVLLAVNLGDDADTTGATCGQLSGAHFGEREIPAEWRERLVRSDEIRQLAVRLARVEP